MLLRLCYTTRRYCHHLFPHHHRHHNPARLFSSSASRNPDEPPNNLKNSNQVLHPPSVLHRHLNPLYSVPEASSLPRTAAIALFATLTSALIALYVVVSTDCDDKSSNPVYDGVDTPSSNPPSRSGSFSTTLNRPASPPPFPGTLSAPSCPLPTTRSSPASSSGSLCSLPILSSILSSANHEVRSGFKLRVAAFLADIAAANASRRSALVGAGGGTVVNWLLESVAVPRDRYGTQSESSRALAFLISDPNVSGAVLGRPGAVPNLFRFIFSCQPHPSKKAMMVRDISIFVLGNCSADFTELPGNWQLDDEDDPLPRGHDFAAGDNGQLLGKKKKASFKEKLSKKGKENGEVGKKIRYEENGSRREKSRHEESGSRKDEGKKKMRRWRHSQDSANSFGPYGGAWTR